MVAPGNGRRDDVLWSVFARPQTTQQVATALGMDRAVVLGHLRELVTMGAVEATGRVWETVVPAHIFDIELTITKSL